MKFISFLFLVYGLSIFSSVGAEEKKYVYVSYCSHFGTGVSYSFQSCINSNFSNIAREIGGFYSYCANYGTGVDYGFTSCVNANFREVRRQLSDNVWIQDCFNFDQNSLDFTFTSCTNTNFNQLVREIAKIE